MAVAYIPYQGQKRRKERKEMISYIRCLGKYAVFSGRAARREYWGFTIVNTVITLIILLLHAKFERGTLHTVLTYAVIIYTAATIVPSLAVMSRRWHDLGRTGFWVLLNLVPGVGTFVSLIFFLGRGDYGSNKYGRDPRERKLRKRK